MGLNTPLKQIIETTRCTRAEAEEALQECNNDLQRAVLYVLEQVGDSDWTEQKKRKGKKADVEEQRPVRGKDSTRGGKPGRGRAPNGRPAAPAPTTVSSSTKPVNPKQKPSAPNAAPKKSSPPPATSAAAVASTAPVQAAVVPPVTTPAPAPAAVPASASPVVIPHAAGRLSFAAVLAGGGKKKEPEVSPVADHVATPSTVEPATSKTVEPEEMLKKEKSVEPALPETPVAASHEVKKQEAPSELLTPKTPKTDTMQELTSQLKNDLGLATPSTQTPTTSHLISADSVSTSSPSNSNVRVIYGDHLNTNKNTDYQFGFESPSVSEEPKPTVSAPPEPVVSSEPPKVMHGMSAASQLGNYGVVPPNQMPPPPHQQPPTPQQQIRRTNPLGFAETSSVNVPGENRQTPVGYNPTAVTTAYASSNFNKPAVTAQSSLSHQQQQQQQSQMPAMHHQPSGQLYNMYNNYPYMNMYSPVATGREEPGPYPYIPYYSMDLSQMMPHVPLHNVPGHQPQQQPPHRNDHHQNFGEIKSSYGQQQNNNSGAANLNSSNMRDSNLNQSSVPPPPGFSGPPSNMGGMGNMGNMFPNMSMFQYPALQMGIGGGGRHDVKREQPQRPNYGTRRPSDYPPEY